MGETLIEKETKQGQQKRKSPQPHNFFMK
jgi:hypothetical protein